MADAADNTLLLSVLREIRKDLADQRSLLLSTVEYMRKMEQHLDHRITSVRDELELIIKSELMGRLTHFETRMEQRFVERTEP